MGIELAEAFPVARQVFQSADEALGFPLSRVCWEGPEDELKQTQNAQPAILVHSYAAWSVISDALSSRVRYAAGHSLGEFTAYAAAGSLSFEDAVRLVRRRGALMAAAREGTMAAVVGLGPEVVEGICERLSADGGVVVAANYNAPQQIVVSGEAAAVERASELAKEAGAKKVIPLAVSAPVHCELMLPAAERLAEHITGITITMPEIPVIHNVDANPRHTVADIREALISQMASPVRWQNTVEYFAANDVAATVECGPGKVLSALVRRTCKAITTHALSDRETIEKVAAELNAGDTTNE